MIRLDEDDLARLRARDTEHFIAAVADQFLAERADLQRVPGRSEVIRRMREAYAHGLSLGFGTLSHLIYMMYLSADWPGLFRRPGTVRYLRRPGATPEQRLDDMIAVLHKLAAPQDGERKT
ncbi:hypothetical protein [Herbaspirillum huttiense]|uniref:hypothetical protein n=1 Tax=Herbaspirillum huttiense TaxID=863372 RepID=UPI0039B114BA